MDTNRKLIIALIAIVIIFLAGVIAIAPHSSNQNQTAYSIPLKAQSFGYFEMSVPVDSNYSIKNNRVEVGRGMVLWQNGGNFSNETDAVVISKNYTANLIPQDMKLVSQNESQKVYMDQNALKNYYRVVKTVNGTDIVVSGYNLQLIENMLNSVKIKDTSKLTLKSNSASAPVNKTPLQSVVEKKQADVKNESKVENTTEPKVENTTEPKVENTTEPKVENTTQPKVENTTEPKVENTTEPKVETVTQKSTEPIMIGGGSFTTGSELSDKTYAKIYLGANHAGETVGVKIFYSRDGASLNKGNYVPVTIDSSGYVSLSSADAYAKYPDFARVEVYDSDGNLLSTQGIHLDPTSGTQYF